MCMLDNMPRADWLLVFMQTQACPRSFGGATAQTSSQLLVTSKYGNSAAAEASAQYGYRTQYGNSAASEASAQYGYGMYRQRLSSKVSNFYIDCTSSAGYCM